MDETHVLIRKDYMEEVNELLQTEVSYCKAYLTKADDLLAGEKHIQSRSRYVILHMNTPTTRHLLLI